MTMKHTIYALELQLVKVTTDVDEYGATVNPRTTERVPLCRHYRGDLLLPEAQRAWEQCDQILKAASQ